MLDSGLGIGCHGGPAMGRHKQFGLEAAFADLGAEIDTLARLDRFQGWPDIVRAMCDESPADRLAAVRACLVRGTPPDAAAPNGATAADLALAQGRRDILCLLADHGAALDRFGWTPLHRAVVLAPLAEVARLADPQACTRIDRRGRSPLRLARHLGRQACAALLAPMTVGVPDGADLSGASGSLPDRAELRAADHCCATRLGDAVWIIGADPAQVVRLSLRDRGLVKLDARGDLPGWVKSNSAFADGNRIVVTGGPAGRRGRGRTGTYVLDLDRMTWTRAGQA